MVPLLLIVLFATAVGGVVCGHCACEEIRTRKLHQKGIAMAVFGLIVCYVSIGVFFYGFWLFGQYWIA